MSRNVSRGRRFCHLRQTYFVTRASWRDAWRDAAKVDLASHLKAPHWGTLQTSSISRLPRRSREPGSPTAELLQAGSSLQSRRDQATRPPRAPYAVSGHLLARTAHFRGGSRKQPALVAAAGRGSSPRGGKARTCSRDRTGDCSRGVSLVVGSLCLPCVTASLILRRPPLPFRVRLVEVRAASRQAVTSRGSSRESLRRGCASVLSEHKKAIKSLTRGGGASSRLRRRRRLWHGRACWSRHARP